MLVTVDVNVAAKNTPGLESDAGFVSAVLMPLAIKLETNVPIELFTKSPILPSTSSRLYPDSSASWSRPSSVFSFKVFVSF